MGNRPVASASYISVSASPTPRVFVSHSHTDDEFGFKLIADIRRALGDETAVWYDASGGLDGGDEWWKKIVTEVTARPIFLLILSPDAMASKWVQDELAMAWDQKNSGEGKRIVPVLARPTDVRADLRTLQLVSFLPPRSYDEALTNLLNVIKRPLRLGKASGGAHVDGSAEPDQRPVELEISVERQAELVALLSGPVSNPARIDAGPLQQVKLTHADVWWLLERQLTAADASSPSQPMLDLRGADLAGIDLHGMELTRLQLDGANLNQARLEGANLSSVHLERANLRGAYLQGANLGAARLEGATLEEAHLEQAWLAEANLEGCYMRACHLESASLYAANLEGASLQSAHLEAADLFQARLEGIDLRRAIFDTQTNLADVRLGGKQSGPLVDSLNWGGANLAVVDWSLVPLLGDEYIARQLRTLEGRRKDNATQIDQLSAAFRASRQLAIALRAQGLSEAADRFTYRSMGLQRVLFRRTRRYMAYLGSFLLDLVAGYGYKLQRSIVAYGVTLMMFAFGYFYLSAAHGIHLSINDAMIISVTVFHGRAFFVELFRSGDPRTTLAAIESIIGMLVEVTFVATLTQRFMPR